MADPWWTQELTETVITRSYDILQIGLGAAIGFFSASYASKKQFEREKIVRDEDRELDSGDKQQQHIYNSLRRLFELVYSLETHMDQLMELAVHGKPTDTKNIDTLVGELEAITH